MPLDQNLKENLKESTIFRKLPPEWIHASSAVKLDLEVGLGEQMIISSGFYMFQKMENQEDICSGKQCSLEWPLNKHFLSKIR